MWRQISKLPFLFGIGGGVYYLMEIMFRGYSHWSMAVLGGICFVLIGLLDTKYSLRFPVWAQMLASAGIITTLEFITGWLLNIKLGLNVWDYGAVPFNLMGQICLPFTILWFFLSFVGIVLDDYLRYWFFREAKPHYRWF
ncbi:putative ABC transporter permease [Diplocloster hominis]|uniref:putative ABC transporter permease n=1 Tax=Diplocloster hominis TaxID=3079010 RepID=UPI0031BA9060